MRAKRGKSVRRLNSFPIASQSLSNFRRIGALRPRFAKKKGAEKRGVFGPSCVLDGEGGTGKIEGGGQGD